MRFSSVKSILVCALIALFALGCNSSGGDSQNGRDKEAPSVPANVSIYSSKPDNTVQVKWTDSTDNVGVEGYKIYRNGAYIASSSSNSYTDTVSASEDRYCYKVSAFDLAGNESATEMEACVNTSNGRVKWSFKTDFPVTSALALAPDGTVYATDGNSLYSVNPDGILKWKYTPDEKIFSDSSPVITQDGSVCFKTEFFLYAVKPDGTLKWKYETSRISYFTYRNEYLAASQDGTIFAVSSDSMYAINLDGTLKWISSGQTSNISIDQAGFIYAQRYDKGLTSFSPDGGINWQLSSYGSDRNNNASGPAFVAGDKLLVTVHHDYANGVSESNDLYALKQDGYEVWKNDKDNIIGSPVADDKENIYACAHGNGNLLVYSMKSDGTIKWKSDEDDYFMRSLAVDAEGTVYIMSMDGNLNAIGDGGKLKWKSRIGASYDSPAIADDGTIYVGAENFIYAISSDSPGLASDSWSRSLGGNSNSRSVMKIKTDSEPPSTPRNLTATAIASSMIQIDWDSSTDALNPVTGYKVFRNGEYLGLKGKGFTDTGLNYSTNYCYQISAVDASGNESEKSVDVCATPLQPAEGILKWKYRTNGTPSIMTDGTIVLWSDNRLVAVNPDGKTKWSRTQSYFDNYKTTIGSDGSIYTGYTIALYPDGNEKWRYAEPLTYTNPSISTNDTLYVPSDSALWAVNQDGTLKWKYEETDQGGYLTSFAATSIGKDGTVYSAGENGFFYAFNNDGSVKWKYSCNAYNSYEPPAIGPDGTIYLINYNNGIEGILALNPDGIMKWETAPDNAGMDNPIIGRDGTVYATGSNGLFYAVNPQGEVKWRFRDNGTKYFTTAIIGNDGIIYIGTYEGNLLCVRQDGTLKWKYKAGDEPVYPYSIVSDGTLYFGMIERTGMADSYLSAIQTNSSGLEAGGWPKAWHDNQNTARME